MYSAFYRPENVCNTEVHWGLWIATIHKTSIEIGVRIMGISVANAIEKPSLSTHSHCFPAC